VHVHYTTDAHKEIATLGKKTNYQVRMLAETLILSVVQYVNPSVSQGLTKGLSQ